MVEPDAAFNGPVPEKYDRFLVPLLFEPYARDIAARVALLGAHNVLEIACGTGVVTRALCAAAPAADIVATDLNPAMIAVARERAASPRIRWQPADVMALPFADRTFDSAVCQFGVMFFPDIEQSFRNVRRVLVPGGVYIFNVWRDLAHNDLARLVSEAAAAEFPDDPPGFLARTPHGHDDPGRIEGALRHAGFQRIEHETVECRSFVDSWSCLEGLVSGSPLRAEIEARAPNRLGLVAMRAAALGEQRFGGAPLDVRMCAHVFTARA